MKALSASCLAALAFGLMVPDGASEDRRSAAELGLKLDAKARVVDPHYTVLEMVLRSDKARLILASSAAPWASHVDEKNFVVLRDGRPADFRVHDLRDMPVARSCLYPGHPVEGRCGIWLPGPGHYDLAGLVDVEFELPDGGTVRTAIVCPHVSFDIPDERATTVAYKKWRPAEWRSPESLGLKLKLGVVQSSPRTVFLQTTLESDVHEFVLRDGPWVPWVDDPHLVVLRNGRPTTARVSHFETWHMPRPVGPARPVEGVIPIDVAGAGHYDVIVLASVVADLPKDGASYRTTFVPHFSFDVE
jgi:hypothetical protein